MISSAPIERAILAFSSLETTQIGTAPPLRAYWVAKPPRPPGVPEPQEALFQWSREQLTPRVDSAVLTDEFAAGHNTWLADDDVDAERQADELREAWRAHRARLKLRKKRHRWHVSGEGFAQLNEVEAPS